MRKVILHHHLFKNAGTSVDALLKSNFPGKWVTAEFILLRPAENYAEVRRWVEREKSAVVFSSHTARLPPPTLAGVEFFPVVFVRHPIDRIASVYAFERTQGGDNFGPTVARNTTLAGYIDIRLSRLPDRQCRNFHVFRLSHMFSGEASDETTRALKALNASLFVGLVEKFDASIARLSEWLSPHFPNFRPMQVAKNVARDPTVPLEQKLDEIRAEIGDACYARLLAANEGDMALFEAVQLRYRDAVTAN